MDELGEAHSTFWSDILLEELDLDIHRRMILKVVSRNRMDKIRVG
jgi:hypothetical protein